MFTVSRAARGTAPWSQQSSLADAICQWGVPAILSCRPGGAGARERLAICADLIYPPRAIVIIFHLTDGHPVSAH